MPNLNDNCGSNDMREPSSGEPLAKPEQIRTTIGKVVKDDQAAAKRFKYLVDKTLAREEGDVRRDESA